MSDNGNGAGWYRVVIGVLAGIIFSVIGGYWPLINKVETLSDRITALEVKIDMLVAKK